VAGRGDGITGEDRNTRCGTREAGTEGGESKNEEDGVEGGEKGKKVGGARREGEGEGARGGLGEGKDEGRRGGENRIELRGVKEGIHRANVRGEESGGEKRICARGYGGKGRRQEDGRSEAREKGTRGRGLER
jgi:hypothetical protein